MWHITGFQLLWLNRDACGAGHYHSFRNTRFHALLGVHDFIYSLPHLSVLGLYLRINDFCYIVTIHCNGSDSDVVGIIYVVYNFISVI